MRLKMLTLLLAGFVSAACSDDDSTGPADQARVRVVHASPDAPDVDVLVDGREVLTDVPYLASSEYLELEPGQRSVQVNAAGTTTAVIESDVNLTGGSDYTLVASGAAASIAPLVLEDDNSAPQAGAAKVRSIHGAPGAPAVDIYVTAPGADLGGETPVLSGVAFGEVGDYVEAPAGEYQVRVTLAGTTTVVIDSGPIELSSGQVRTAIAVDAPGGGAPFDLLLLSDLN